MPPAAAPADQTLNLAARASFAWAEFDPAWYLRAYPAIRDRLADPTPDAVLRFYLEIGQGHGHSPNRFFDEAWYRHAYPDVAAALGRGPASGFDHYCRGAFRIHAPHWLFDEHLYRRRHPDLTEAVLDAAHMANGYDHYLRHGAQEKRIGHRFFDPLLYLAQLDPEAARDAAAVGPFHHYLRCVEAGGPERRTTVYFDPAWYVAKYPGVAEAIAAGVWRCALHHYLANDTPTAFDPLPEFSESWYLARYPDIAAAVEKGGLRHGYLHFLTHGAGERRSPGPAIDLRYYAGHDAARAALHDGSTPDPFTHYLAIGKAAGLPAITPPEERVSEGQAKTLFRRKATGLLPLFGRRPLDFTCTGTPALSVVMIVHDRFALTLQALGSLRSNYAGQIELVLVDSGSTDEARFIGRYVRGANVVRFDANLGFLRGCNGGLMFASAEAVLLLNNDVELAPGAVAAALDRLMSDSTIGAVGGKVIRTHGLLQEAGSIVWADGTASGYLRDGSPLAPEANFVRDVDFCSGVFLMLRRTVLERLDGFDEAFAPAYYEDTDLCLRIAESGMRVVYDPSVVVHHLEYGTARNALKSEAAIGRNRQTFLRKHQALLCTRLMPDSKAAAFARFAGPRRTRVLFIEDTVPLRRIGSGFVRSNDILRVMAALGYQVTVFPVNGSDFDLAAVFGDMPDTVEVMHDRTLTDLQAFLASRPDYFDVIWIVRTHNLDRVREMIEGACGTARIILDAEAIEAQRKAVLASLPGREAPFDYQSAVRQEFANAGVCEQIVTVSGQDAAALRDLGFSRVAVVGHMRGLQPTPRPFAGRNGILFVGAIHEIDSPNYDSLCWLIGEVLPLIERSLQWRTRLTVAGYAGEKVSLDRFRDHPRVTLLGAVADIQALYDRHRVFVAPTRYAGGTPYKVYEAASFGLPVVATRLLAQQMGWEDEVEFLAADCADPGRFAELVIMIYRDPMLWQKLRDNALKRLRTENSQQQYTGAIRAVLER